MHLGDFLSRLLNPISKKGIIVDDATASRETLLNTVSELRTRVGALEAKEGERRSAEERASRFGRILDDSLNEIYAFDTESFHFTQVNRGARENLGYSFKELKNFTPLDIMPDLNQETFFGMLSRLMNGEESRIIFSTLQRRKSGSTYPIDVDLQLSLHGSTKDFIAIVLDTSDQELAREALQESESRASAILESAIESIITISQKGIIESANPATETLFGYSMDELIGKNVRILMPEPFRSEHDSHIQRFIDTNEKRIIGIGREVVGLRKDGTEVPLHLSVAEVELSNRRVFTGILRDLTDLKESQQKLVDVQEQLLRAQKLEAIGQLAGGIAHDFNNYLTVILGNTELLTETCGETSEEEKIIIGEINHAAECSAALTRQLLAFSRKQVLSPEILNLNDLISKITKMLHRVLGEHIDIQRFVEKDLDTVYLDPTQMEQVILNLALNARDAMRNTGTLTIETANAYVDEEYAKDNPGAIPGRYVRVSISDDGDGMDEETLQHIFDPFFTTKAVGEGTGLGLSTVFGIVKQSRGNITVYSEVGQGTAFRLYFPSHEGRTEERIIEESAPAIGGTETILLVEDQEQLRTVVTSFLAARGYEVIRACDGIEAIHLMRDQTTPVDLLITDVIMPRMGGIELANQLCELNPELRVLYVSGYTEKGLFHQGKLPTGVALVTKPFRSKELLAKVREVLDQPPPPRPER